MEDKMVKQKMYPITSICKEDILECFRARDNFRQVKRIVAKMKRGEMEYLASKMADAYMNVFWDDLVVIFEERFIEEEQRKLE